MRARSSVLLFVVLLVVLDVAVVVALGQSLALGPDQARILPPPELNGNASGFGAGARTGDIGHDPGWALCQTRFADRDVSPISVAITYLDAELDDAVTTEEVRGWFGAIDSAIVDVYKLEQADGRRRISFELARSKWPDWDRIAGNLRGEAICGRLRAALVAAGIGRPRAAASPGSAPAAGSPSHLVRSRHDFEFIYARRPAMYRTIEWAGTLDHALEIFVELRNWRNQPRGQ